MPGTPWLTVRKHGYAACIVMFTETIETLDTSRATPWRDHERSPAIPGEETDSPLRGKSGRLGFGTGNRDLLNAPFRDNPTMVIRLDPKRG